MPDDSKSAATGRNLIGWLAGIAATVIGGVLVAWFTAGGPNKQANIVIVPSVREPVTPASEPGILRELPGKSGSVETANAPPPDDTNSPAN